jgi:hypothetical protein
MILTILRILFLRLRNNPTGVGAGLRDARCVLQHLRGDLQQGDCYGQR